MTDTPHESADSELSDSSPAEENKSDVADEAAQGPAAGQTRWHVRRVVVAGGLAAVLICGLALVWGGVLDWWASEPTAPPPTATPTQTQAAVPSPFEGTPAETFAEGAAGIVLPEAEAIGDFTAEEVADALEQVRQALIAARLDHAMLVDHDLEHFLSALAPDRQPGLRNALDVGALGPFPTRIASDAVLAPVPPRVEGRMSYQIAVAEPRSTPVLEVVTRFVWVYPLEEDTHGIVVVVVGDELVWEARLGRPWLDSSQGLWLIDGVSHAWGADCDAYEDGLLRPVQPPADDLTNDAIFDPNELPAAGDDC